MRFKKKAPLLVLGVALFTALFTVNNQKIKTAKASTDTAFVTLTFPDGNNKGVSSYTSTWTATIGNYTWSISNFNNNNNGWNYIKAGSKNSTSTATIKNSAVYEEVVSSIVVSIDKYTSGMINYVSLTSTDSSGNEVYTSKITDLSEAGITTTSGGGDLTFSVPEDNRQENLYYTLTFDCAQGTSNGLIQVSKVVYKKSITAPTSITASLDGESITEGAEFSLTEGDTKTLTCTVEPSDADASVTYTSSDETSVSVSSDGILRALKATSAPVTITITSVVDTSITFSFMVIVSENENIFSVYFYNDEEIYYSASINKGETVSKPDTDPTKEDYNFLGWYEDGATSAYNFETEVTTDLILYAKFEKIASTDIATVISNNDETSTIYVTGEVTGVQNGSTYIQDSTGSLMLYKFSDTSLHVGNLVTVKGLYKLYDDSISELTSVSLVSIDSEDTTIVNIPSLSSISDMTSANYTKYFELTNVYVESVSENSSKYTLTITGSSATLYSYGTSYTEGLSDITDSLEGKYVDVTGVLYKVSSKVSLLMNTISLSEQYTLSFNLNGGTSSTIEDQILLPSAIPTKPEDPTRDATSDYSYEFAGWYTDENCTDGNEFDFGPISVDTTLYAKWDEISLNTIDKKFGISEVTSNLNFSYKESTGVKSYSFNKSIETIASEENWTSATQYSNYSSDNLSIEISGNANCGKYYYKNNSWRLYEYTEDNTKKSGTITFTVNGTISKINLTYDVDNSGLLYTDSDKTNSLSSGKDYEVNASSVTLYVGGTSTNSNTYGQVHITNIQVEYSAQGTTYSDFSSTTMKFKYDFDFSSYTKDTDYISSGIIVTDETDFVSTYSSDLLGEDATSCFDLIKEDTSNYLVFENTSFKSSYQVGITLTDEQLKANYSKQLLAVAYIQTSNGYTLNTPKIVSIKDMLNTYSTSTEELTFDDGTTTKISDLAVSFLSQLTAANA